jgi:hypothetical protein
LRPNNSFPVASNLRFPLISSIVSSSKNEPKVDELGHDVEDIVVLIGHEN